MDKRLIPTDLMPKGNDMLRKEYEVLLRDAESRNDGVAAKILRRYISELGGAKR